MKFVCCKCSALKDVKKMIIMPWREVFDNRYCEKCYDEWAKPITRDKK